jgi:uncharacterized Zn finger protein (UPF0148 family)
MNEPICPYCASIVDDDDGEFFCPDCGEVVMPIPEPPTEEEDDENDVDDDMLGVFTGM